MAGATSNNTTAVENVDLESFLVTKHSWKGKYKRILSVSAVGISTYNPEKFDSTNRWLYGDVISVLPNRTANVSTTKQKGAHECYLFYTLSLNALSLF